MLVWTHGEKWSYGACIINRYAENRSVCSEIYINMRIGVVVLRLALNCPKPKRKPFFL